MVFIDLEKAYDRAPIKVLRRCLAKRSVPMMCMRVRTLVEDMEDFSINIGLHQGSALRPFLFIVIMDKLTKEIQITYLGVCYLLTI